MRPIAGRDEYSIMKRDVTLSAALARLSRLACTVQVHYTTPVGSRAAVRVVRNSARCHLCYIYGLLCTDMRA